MMHARARARTHTHTHVCINNMFDILSFALRDIIYQYARDIVVEINMELLQDDWKENNIIN